MRGQPVGMTALPDCITPDRWLRQIFSARAVADGGIVRRQVRDVERILGRDRFTDELRRRGYQAVENAGQFVIFCNREPVSLLR